MKTFGDITIPEWGALLEHVAKRIRGQWGWLDVTVDGTWPAIRVEAQGYSASLSVEPSASVDDQLHIRSRIGSATCPTGTIQHAKMLACNLMAVCDAMIIAEGMVAEVRVWARNCPCSHCSGRGYGMHVKEKCKNCNGSGIKPDTGEA